MVKFHKFKNEHGEVYAASKKIDHSTYAVGFAFCNPKDLQIRRKIRSQKGKGLAKKRLDSVPVMVETTGNIRAELKELLRNAGSMGEIAMCSLLNVKPYRSDNGKSGEFVKWFRRFARCLSSED